MTYTQEQIDATLLAGAASSLLAAIAGEDECAQAGMRVALTLGPAALDAAIQRLCAAAGVEAPPDLFADGAVAQ